MRQLLIFILIMVAGVVGGIAAGKAVTGGAELPEGTGPSAFEGITYPGEAPLLSASSTDRLSSGSESSSRESISSTDGSSRESVSSREQASRPGGADRSSHAPGTSGRSPAGPSRSPGIFPPDLTLSRGDVVTSDGLFQVSRQVPSQVLVEFAGPTPDINQDGVVDRFDLRIVANALATADPAGDVNGDGKVDILDLAIVGAQFGQQSSESIDD